MSTFHVSAQEMSDLYTSIYCVYAAFVILLYDWLLCLDQEVRYIWKWHSGVTISTLVYALSRYGMLVHNILVVATIYPMSNLVEVQAIVNSVDVDVNVVTEILGMTAVYTFSALRAYALSNKNVWLTTAIMLLVLPPVVIFIVQSVYEYPINLPSPINCTSSSSIPQAVSISAHFYASVAALLTRASQLAMELLVIAITWWYSYRSYCIRKGSMDYGKSLSSLIVYSGSVYFLFLASLYTLDLVFQTASVPSTALYIDGFLELFYDPIASILVCRFMLSLRQFDASTTSTTSGTGSRVREHTESTVLQFGAQPSESLPAFIASFAHPVHVDSSLSETDPDAETLGDDRLEWREMDVAVTTLDDPPVTPC